MSAFDHLHPALQHHIVNSLGWRTLRPLQEQSIDPLLAGQHALLLAPTAGGKTEAAFFPVLSRMMQESWRGLSVVYFCPIKALLNNLETRLDGYGRLVGRRCALWHGDVTASARNKLIQDPPDVLLTTPESLEVILVSKRSEPRRFLANLRVVIVDEIHAFAGDDRGWHLLALLARLSKLVGRELQRVGLSATVGNPEQLLTWLAAEGSTPRQVIAPTADAATEVDVKLDYVGSLENASLVISRLHRGEKRLVFCDSRARVEKLASELRHREVPTFVSHSSLSVDERRRAEHAFTTATDAVIVATSTLELGIDVGDLDRVIQIDAPSTVASFLQRLGRTGRRSGTRRNCLFLTTRPDTLVQAAGLITLWKRGFVEPIEPPPIPYHIFAQQIMALALQEGGLPRASWKEWIGNVPAFQFERGEADTILEHMLAEDLLWEEGGLLWFGLEGEHSFGRKNFLDLMSVFDSPPQFTVLHGRNELGLVHQLSFRTRQGEPAILVLGGRSWLVTYIDWEHRVAHVQPSDQKGRSRWLGAPVPLSYEYCQAMLECLTSTAVSAHWSHRATEEMTTTRADHAWLRPNATTLLLSPEKDQASWYTFAGAPANTVLASGLTDAFGTTVRWDNTALHFTRPVGAEELRHASKALLGLQPDPAGIEDAIQGLKFHVCLPQDLARETIRRRDSDSDAVEKVIESRIVVYNEEWPGK